MFSRQFIVVPALRPTNEEATSASFISASKGALHHPFLLVLIFSRPFLSLRIPSRQPRRQSSPFCLPPGGVLPRPGDNESHITCHWLRGRNRRPPSFCEGRLFPESKWPRIGRYSRDGLETINPEIDEREYPGESRFLPPPLPHFGLFSSLANIAVVYCSWGDNDGLHPTKSTCAPDSISKRAEALQNPAHKMRSSETPELQSYCHSRFPVKYESIAAIMH